MEIARYAAHFGFIAFLLFSEVVYSANLPPVKAVSPTPMPVTTTKSLPSVTIKASTSSQPCTSKTAESSLHLASAKFWKVIQKKPVTIYFMDLDKCFVNQQKVNIFETKADDGLVYWRAMRGTGNIQKVESVTFGDYKRREATEITRKELTGFKNKLMNYTGKKEADLDNTQLTAVTLVADRIEDHLKTYGSPRVHPIGKSLKKRDFVEQLKSGHVYDIRPPQMAKKVPLKNAKSLTFGDYSMVIYRILSPDQMKKRKVRFRLSPLPRDKAEPVYIISGCPGEFSGYNALTLLASMGYKNIGWFPGGMSEYGKKHQMCITPDKMSEGIIVNAEKVKELIGKKDTSIVDVRSESKFTLKNSKNFPFPEKRNGLSMPVYRSGVTLAGLVEHKETYKRKFKMPAKNSILIIGDNEYDWRGYKAAIYFKYLGYQNIYWYRDGMRDWAQKVLVHPEEYKVNRKVRNGDLY